MGVAVVGNANHRTDCDADPSVVGFPNHSHPAKFMFHISLNLRRFSRTIRVVG